MGMKMAFIIWSIVAIVFPEIGIWSWKAEKPVEFWAYVTVENKYRKNKTAFESESWSV